jgi:hypothetical protein
MRHAASEPGRIDNGAAGLAADAEGGMVAYGGVERTGSGADYRRAQGPPVVGARRPDAGFPSKSAGRDR